MENNNTTIPNCYYLDFNCNINEYYNNAQAKTQLAASASVALKAPQISQQTIKATNQSQN